MWKRSSYSEGNGGECVECAPGLARSLGHVPVRDSKNPNGRALAVSTPAWRHFLASLGR
ncbi:DUF397 domain-containing protein [Streptomyces sp. NPDC049879]|uniref:DUF397 domain-containing protein n=1 Tax=Streptomyces sp. NPDC049879 TaxID=3365598 RepID=UPI0037BAEA84